MRKVPQWEFDFYALALPRGHDFGSEQPVAAWGGSDDRSCGIVTHNAAADAFKTILMRRRVDSVWTVTRQESSFASIDAARDALEPSLVEGQPPEPMPAGPFVDRRYSIWPAGSRARCLDCLPQRRASLRRGR